MSTREERFWNKVAKAGPDECWLWIGSCTTKGYGQFTEGRGTLKAHRVSYELHHGSIPDGLHVLHHCDNPPCVNPAHLYAGTNADNCQDKVARGRTTARLDSVGIAIARRMRAHGATQSEVAACLSVSPQTIRRVEVSGVP